MNVLSPIFESKIEYNDPNLKGLFGNTMSVNALNRIYSLIEVNKRTGDTMYTFPHINYFNVMSGLNSPTFAKVHYFDVCPDFIIERDLEALRENPPKFVYAAQKFAYVNCFQPARSRAMRASPAAGRGRPRRLR